MTEPTIRLLGRVAIAGQPIRAPKLACVLAVLALHPGTPVAQSDLIDQVWDGDPPDAVLSALYSYVARLRAALKAVPGATIRRAGSHGYVLDVDPCAVDVLAVRALRAEARTTGLDAWRQACELVGADALVGIGGRWAEQARAVLAAERLELLAERYTAELEAGRHEAVLGELVGLADAAPLVEPLAGLLMLAYYRCGRPAEALTRFEAMRTRLREELGADPSTQLRELHVRILQQDPTLGLEVAPIQLPADISGFTGRAAELGALDQLLDPAPGVPLVAVVGPGGAGKTALAVHWGHSRVRDFPGGLLYVNLRGFDEGDAVSPRDALGRLLLALSVPGEEVPDDVDAAAELFRAVTADRGVLVVLDNARNAEQVRPLLPGVGCHTIVTSRDRLTGLIALNDARPVQVGMFSRSEAVELLTQVLGVERVGGEPEAAERLVDLCGQLALALRIAAAHVAAEPHLSIGDYVSELVRRDRLEVLAVEGDPAAAVTASLDLSYRVLDGEAQRLFALLGALPGEDFAEELVVAVSESDPTAALRRLLTANLMEQHQARRYRLHDLVRLYAARVAERDLTPEDRAQLVDRFIDWHHDRAYEPIAAEETNVFLAAEALQDHPRLWRLVLPLRNTLNEWRSVERIRRLIEVATRRAEQADDALGRFRMTVLTASAARIDGDTAAAIEIGTRAVALAAPLTDREQTTANGNLGIYLHDHGDFARSAPAFIRAVELAAAHGNIRSQVTGTGNMIQVLLRIGRFDEAAEYIRRAEQATADSRTDEQRIRLGVSTAELHVNRGEFDQATQAIAAALSIARGGSFGHLDIWCLQVQAQIHLHAGRLESARSTFETELRLVYERKMSSMAPAVLLDLAEVLVELGDHAAAHDLVTEARAKWPRIARGSQIYLTLVLAGVHNGLGNHPTARDHATQAAHAYAAMPWPARQELALRALTTAQTALGAPTHPHREAADRIAAPINRLRRGQVRRTA
ncbi:hypothetical protein HPO96_06845 [Kribbella sandramycini]|uniref:DNA-binding SARP family transcriptional activator n=1 Tax=Kribbella sandramycini TaxID=60450 RepID=A0A7Y4KWP3_9ACTN|nr:BTAD domain-containing putative transcriptional regulator [Kribbella sandramycini]MBB6567435.1 DNA-binding SARP family transcriptional activator [Kribbella sandramycini]NOL39955.1 hypothetical protein [Kribbella sandramycini]